MGKSRLMDKIRTPKGIAAIALAIALSVPITAWAAMAVVDAKAIAEMQALLSETKKMVEDLENMKNDVDDLLSSAGVKAPSTTATRPRCSATSANGPASSLSP